MYFFSWISVYRVERRLLVERRLFEFDGSEFDRG